MGSPSHGHVKMLLLKRRSRKMVLVFHSMRYPLLKKQMLKLPFHLSFTQPSSHQMVMFALPDLLSWDLAVVVLEKKCPKNVVSWRKKKSPQLGSMQRPSHQGYGWSSCVADRWWCVPLLRICWRRPRWSCWRRPSRVTTHRWVRVMDDKNHRMLKEGGC